MNDLIKQYGEATGDDSKWPSAVCGYCDSFEAYGFCRGECCELSDAAHDCLQDLGFPTPYRVTIRFDSDASKCESFNPKGGDYEAHLRDRIDYLKDPKKHNKGGPPHETI